MIAVVLLGAVAAFLMMYNKPHRSIADEAADFKLSASEIIAAFSEDEAHADSQYTGKVVEVRGPLNSMTQNDSTLIILIGADTDMMGVSCFMEKSQMAASAELTPGDQVTVKGICNGVLIDVILDKGVLVRQ